MNLKNLPVIAVLTVVLVLLSVYYYHETIFYFPSHIHAWTQSDRLALVHGFLNNGFNLLKPSTLNLSTVDGITGVDLPIHEYLIALLMKLTGSKSPVIFRLYTLCFSFIGYIFLFRLAYLVTKSQLKSLAVVLFVFSCPVITYYQAGFIPSSTSFFEAITAYYFFFRYREENRPSHLYVSVAVMTLAALSRTPFSIFLFALFLQECYYGWRSRKGWKPRLLAFLPSFGIVAAYQLYKSYLNKTYGSQLLTHITPAENLQQLRSLIESLTNNWLLHYFTLYHYIFIGIALVFLIVYFLKNRSIRHLPGSVLLQAVIALAGGLVYFLLMARQFADHDYYFIDSFYPGITLLLIGAIYTAHGKNAWQITLLSALCGLLVAGGIRKSAKVQKELYTDQPWDHTEVTRKNFTGAAELLDSLNIPRDAKMLVVDAYSTNAPLILMERRGYTLLTTGRKELMEIFNSDADYIVTQDIFLPSSVLSTYPSFAEKVKRIGGNGKISVYEPMKYRQSNTIHDLLGIDRIVQQAFMGFEDKDDVISWDHIDKKKDTLMLNGWYSGYVGNNDEFGPAYKITVGEQWFNRILYTAFFWPVNRENELKIVCSVSRDQENIYYWEFPFYGQNSHPYWNKFSCLFTPPFNVKKGDQVSLYIWNPNGMEVFMEDVKIEFYKR